MQNPFAFLRSISRLTRRPPRRYRPILEQLETRNLLAFNLTISTALTTGVAIATANGTTTFTAVASGANLNIDDITGALASGNNVLVSSGDTGTQIGSISTNGFSSRAINNVAGTTLTIQSGSGSGSGSADISLPSLQLQNQGNLVVHANDNVTLTGDFLAATMTIVADSGSIAMPSGQLQATTLSLTAFGDIGTAADPVRTSVDQLTTDNSAGVGSQFITEASGITALQLKAPNTAGITLVLTTGDVSDTDASVDIAASSATVTLGDPLAKDFGTVANPIRTSVNALSVTTVAAGKQCILEDNGITALNLNAGATGDVVLRLTLGAVTDSDAALDITAGAVVVKLDDALPKNFGTAANPIGTSVITLAIDTSAGGGSQFVAETDGLDAQGLNAGLSGDITLNLAAGNLNLSSDVKASTVRLQAAGNITQAATGIVTASVLGAHSMSGSVNLDTASNAVSSRFAARADALNASVKFRNAVSFATGQVTSSGGFSPSVTGVTTNGGPITMAADTGTLTLGTSGVANSGLNTGIGNFVRLQATAGGVSQTAEGVIISNFLAVRAAGAISLAAAANDNNSLAIQTTGKVDYRDAGTVFIQSISASGVFTANVIGVTSGGSDVNLLLGADLLLNDAQPNQPSINAGATGDVRIIAAGMVSQSNANDTLVGDEVAIRSGGNVTLTGDNDVNSLAIFTTGQVQFRDINNLSVATVGVPAPNPIGFVATTGITSGNNGITLACAAASSNTLVSLDAGTGNITLSSGTFNLAAGNALADLSTVVVNSPAVLNLASIDEDVGGLAGNGTVAFKSDAADHRLRVGLNNADTAFSGVFAGNDIIAGLNVDRLTKAGSGTLTLGGVNTFAGTYEVTAGTLIVTGTITSGENHVQVTSGGILAGTGMVNRDVVLTTGARLAPGTSPGVLRTTNLDFHEATSLDIEITSAAAGQFDQANVIGSVVLDTSGPGVALNIAKSGNLNLQNGNQLVIVNNDGSDAVQGTFAGLPQGASLGSNFLGTGLTATITYTGGDGNDVAILLSPGSLFPWHNTTHALDVNNDAQVVAGDALAIINYINAFGSGLIPANAVIGLPYGFLDTRADNNVAPNDVIDIINFINAFGPGLPGPAGEGEGVAPSSSATLLAPLAPSPEPLAPSPDLLLLLALDLSLQIPRRRT